MKKLFLLLALVGMVAVGCTEGGVDDDIDNGGNNTEQPGEDDDDENEIPDDAYITLNKEVLTFVPDGESVEVKVYSNYEWTLTNNCDWVTTSISGGEASEEGTAITLTADLTYDDREGTITFSCGKAKKLLVVSQSFKEAIIADENNVFNVPAEGGNVIINYQTTVECEVVIPSDAQHWISLAPETRGLESGCATLNIAKSKAGADRRAVVKVVKMGDQSVFAEYTITQERNMDYIIFYTTTNGETIRPNNFDYLTNTYEDGVGMLAFDGSKVASIGDGAFKSCSSLASITIPDSVTSIGSEAFRDCTSLTSVTIPDSVTEIGDSAFSSCASLTSVTIPDSVTSIGDGAFYSCTSLTSITIPNSVTSIGNAAFRSCTSLTSITIPDSVTSIGSEAFRDCTSLTSITIPDSITSIDSEAFRDCTSLTSVYITDIAAWCNISFGNNSSNPLSYAGNLYLNNELVTDLIIPDGVTSIGSCAFCDCSSLTSITIPDGVTEIGGAAFSGCTSLTSVTIPDSVTSIGGAAFYRCNSLTSITIPDSVTSIGREAFEYCFFLTSVYITDIAAWCNISFGYYDSNPLYYAGNLYLNNELVTDLIIPDGVTKIGSYAFYECYSLTSVTIPDSVTSIGDSAFSHCTSLTSVTIGNGVTSIEDYAFYECDLLTSVTIPDSVTSIGLWAFRYCDLLTSVTIGKGVTSIEESAFSDCTSLKEVYCKPTTPPSMGYYDVFYNNASGRTIYVPRNSVDAYKSAWRWKYYAASIVGYDF